MSKQTTHLHQNWSTLFYSETEYKRYLAYGLYGVRQKVGMTTLRAFTENLGDPLYGDIKEVGVNHSSEDLYGNIELAKGSHHSVLFISQLNS